MLSKVHSRTAELTAAIRAGHLLYDAPLLFEDPFALALTSPGWRLVCRNAWLHRLIVRGLLEPLRPVHGWILVRDFLNDLRLKEFVERGNKQYVLLGAGFDTTAVRNPAWLAGVRIIEVDHPATQAVKIKRLQSLDCKPELDHDVVAVDFERESLADGLRRSRYDNAEPAFFAWQGVIYYLSADAIKETLAGIAELAAPGSELIFDFLLPNDQLAKGAGRVKSFAGMFNARLGERYISFHTAEDVTALLNEAGFELINIQLDEELESLYLNDREDGLSVMRGFGIAHARRC